MGLTMIARPAADEYAEFYAGYVAQVPEGSVLELLEQQRQEMTGLRGSLPPERARYRYAPGKWSVAEIVGHITDAERIFAYRALRIARGDETPLPGFEENSYVAAAAFDDRPFADVLHEYDTVRQATLALLRGFPVGVWTRRGTASGHPVSVRALAYIIAGHERHHIAVLRTRYGL